MPFTVPLKHSAGPRHLCNASEAAGPFFPTRCGTKCFGRSYHVISRHLHFPLARLRTDFDFEESLAVWCQGASPCSATLRDNHCKAKSQCLSCLSDFLGVAEMLQVNMPGTLDTCRFRHRHCQQSPDGRRNSGRLSTASHGPRLLCSGVLYGMSMYMWRCQGSDHESGFLREGRISHRLSWVHSCLTTNLGFPPVFLG